jgi:hypothetical protein
MVIIMALLINTAMIHGNGTSVKLLYRTIANQRVSAMDLALRTPVIML